MSLIILYGRITILHNCLSGVAQRNYRSATFEPSFLIVIIDYVLPSISLSLSLSACVDTVQLQSKIEEKEFVLPRGGYTFLDHTQSSSSLSSFRLETSTDVHFLHVLPSYSRRPFASLCVCLCARVRLCASNFSFRLLLQKFTRCLLRNNSSWKEECFFADSTFSRTIRCKTVASLEQWIVIGAMIIPLTHRANERARR